MAERWKIRNLMSRRCAPIATVAVACASGLGACAAPNQGWQSLPGGGGDAGVFRMPQVTAYDRQPGVPFDFQRFEYARLDASLSPTARNPIVSQLQWPQAPVPLERPVQFQRWEQR